MGESVAIGLIAYPKPKRRINVLVSLRTGRMAVKERDGKWCILTWEGDNGEG